MIASRHVASAAAACAALGLAACTAVGPDFAPGPVAVQARWSTVPADTPAEVDAATFWAAFGDPALPALIDRALAANPTLRQAAARVDEARAQLAVTRGGSRPSVQAGAQAAYANPDATSQLLGTHGGSTTAQLALQASWEPDLWGAVRRAVESDAASLDADRAAWQAARVALAATVADTYIDLRTLEQRARVAQANADAQAENLRIARARLRAGATSELDVRQAQTQWQLTTAQVPPLRAAVRQHAHALAVLAGATPDTDVLPAAAAPLRVPAGLPLAAPHDLLRRRPDVVQAERTAAAQSARIGQSAAALYPSFSLGGAFGTQSGTAGPGSLDLFSWGSRFTSASAGLVLPLFDRGRLQAQVDVQDARFRQAILDYQARVLQAQQEVEDALAATRGSVDARAALAAARGDAERGVALALERYKAGDTDFTTVTAATQARLQVEDSLATAQGDVLQGYVAAYRALGGGWSGELADPPADAPPPLASSPTP